MKDGDKIALDAHVEASFHGPLENGGAELIRLRETSAAHAPCQFAQAPCHEVWISKDDVAMLYEAVWEGNNS